MVAALTMSAGLAGRPVAAHAAATSTQDLVKATVAANPGARAINETSILVKPGVVITVPGRVPPGATMTVPLPDGKKTTAAATCASGWLCMWQNPYRGGAKIAFYYCTTELMANHRYVDTDGTRKTWKDTVSSIWNNQTGGAVSYFYNFWWGSYHRMGSLSAGNYLQDLRLDASAEGGNWDNKLDRVSVC
jgi:hypothetical protein